MIRELELHRKAPKTVEAYVTAVAQLGRFYGRSPEKISLEEIRDFLHHLIRVQKVAYSTCNQKLAGIRFLYREVLGQQDFELRVPAKRSGRLPEPLSRGEIARLLDATRNAKHRVLLMTTYGGGLRVSELVRLKPRDIHAERMLLRVDQGKGHKDRYTLLSPRLLEELRAIGVSTGPRLAGGPRPAAFRPGIPRNGGPRCPLPQSVRPVRHPLTSAYEERSHLRTCFPGSPWPLRCTAAAGDTPIARVTLCSGPRYAPRVARHCSSHLGSSDTIPN